MNVKTQTDQQLTGIGGWLILVAIALIGSIIRITITLYQTFETFSYPIEQIADYFSISSSAFFTFLLFEAISNSLFWLFTLYLTYLFFKKDYRVPKYFIFWCVINLIVLVIDGGISNSLGFPEDLTGSTKEVIRQSVYCAIWIPYFLRSVRVKNTFVHNKPSTESRIVM